MRVEGRNGADNRTVPKAKEVIRSLRISLEKGDPLSDTLDLSVKKVSLNPFGARRQLKEMRQLAREIANDSRQKYERDNLEELLIRTAAYPDQRAKLGNDFNTGLRAAIKKAEDVAEAAHERLYNITYHSS